MAGDLFTRFVAFLTADDWDVQAHPEEGDLQAEVAGEHGEWTCYGQVRGERHVIFYSGGPDVPPERREAAMELVTRANWGLAVGNFELDLETGELNFKTSLDLEGVDPEPSLLRHLVYANLHTFDLYLPAIRQVLDGGAAPADALAAIEGA